MYAEIVSHVPARSFFIFGFSREKRSSENVNKFCSEHRIYLGTTLVYKKIDDEDSLWLCTAIYNTNKHLLHGCTMYSTKCAAIASVPHDIVYFEFIIIIWMLLIVYYQKQTEGQCTMSRSTFIDFCWKLLFWLLFFVCQQQTANTYRWKGQPSTIIDK